MRGSLPLDPLGFGGDFEKVENPDQDFPPLNAQKELEPKTMGDIAMLDRDDPDRRWQQVRVESNPGMTPDRFRQMYLGQFDRDDQDYGRCAYCDAELGEEHRPDCEYWARRRIREYQHNRARATALKEMQEQARPRQFSDAADAMVYALTGPKLHNMPKRRVVIEKKS